MKYFFAEKLDKIKERRDGNMLELVNKRLKSKDKKEKSYIDYTHELVTKGELTQDEEIADIFVFFAAGMDTTSSTLSFGVALLAKYQNIQDKIRKELFDIMGKEYNLKFANKVPLLRAAVHEILRISSVVYSGVAHKSFKDYWIELDDGARYKVPKNTQIHTNIDYIHIYGKGKDEHWKRTNGDEIILENFLTEDEDGGIVVSVLSKSFIVKIYSSTSAKHSL